MLLQADYLNEDLLLPMNVQKAVHQCYQHEPIFQGEVICLSDHVKIKNVPSKIENLIGREKHLNKIVKSIMSDQRLVMILGLHGVGKSAVAKNAVHYMLERKYFTGGVIFVDLKGIRSARMMTRKICKILINNLDRDYSLRAELDDMDQEAFIDFFVEFFSKEDLDEKLRKKKRCSKNKSHKFLLLLDNAELLITESSEDFKSFLSRV